MNRSDYQRDYRQKYKDQARRVNLTFSLSEIADLEAAAKSSGQPLAQFIKEHALRAFMNKPSLPDEVVELLQGHERVVRNIANNINQMTRHSHRLEQVVDEQEVFLHLRLLEQQLRQTIGRVNGFTDPDQP